MYSPTMGFLDWSNDDFDDFALPDYDFGFGHSSAHRSAAHSQQPTHYGSSTRSSDDSSRKLDKTISYSSSQTSSVFYSSASSPRAPATKVQASHLSTINLSPPSALEDETCTRKRSSSAPSKTKTRQRKNSTARRPRPGPARRAFSFDLYHEDEELQEAEPRITFCDICRKPCEIH